MPNRAVFETRRKVNAKAATGKTSEGRPAYTLHAEQALAELACVGTFQNTYYNDAGSQLKTLLALAAEVSDEYLAKVAIYSRIKGYMKDMPAALMAVLSTRNPNMFRRVFNRVIDNPRMIRGFVQIMRSGAVGRKSLGSAPKKMVQAAIQNSKDFVLLNGSVGKNPSLADVVKMVHPYPCGNSTMTANQMKHAFAWLVGKPFQTRYLPNAFKYYENFKSRPDTLEVPRCDFRLIDGLDTMTDEHWRQLGYGMTWTQAKMSLNTLLRHGALEDTALVDHLAKLLVDPEKIKSSRQFPYSMMTGYNYLDPNVPAKLKNALQKALELSIANVPQLPGRVLVAVDISGSMGGLVSDKGATRCWDVAGLFAAAVLRKNPDAKITAFSETLFHRDGLNSMDSIATITKGIIGTGFHGCTQWDAPINWALHNKEHFDAIIWISDMEANMDANSSRRTGWINDGCYVDDATSAGRLLTQYRKNVNPNCKAITMNVVANAGHAQLDGEKDPNLLQISGFSDHVFDVIASFMEAKEPGHWVKIINDIAL